MNALARFEEFVEDLLEGSLTQLMRSPMHPAEIAKRLERAMELGQRASVGKVLVPTRYTVGLHPEDYAALEPARGVLEREMARFIEERARERGFSLLVRPRVTLAAQAGARRRQVRVEAELQDAVEEETGELEYTASLGPAAQPHPMPRARLHFLDAGGQPCAVLLDRPQVDIGRARDNDVILDDPRVSRHHARLVARFGQFVVLDLGSTYGTTLNGQAVQESVLRSGDALSFGGVEVYFEEL